MASAPEHDLIIIRRVEEEEHETHNTAWKVAHADFMTAMMAFFLIMWLINATDDEAKKEIANYFNPINLAASPVEHKGVNDPKPLAESPTRKKGVNDPKPMKVDDPDVVGHEMGDGDKAPSGSKPGGEKVQAGPDTSGVVRIAIGQQAATPREEAAAFQDPYAVLSKLASLAPADTPADPDVVIGVVGQEGVATSAAQTQRDPFDPTYWQLRDGPKRKTPDPSARNGTTSPPQPANIAIDARSSGKEDGFALVNDPGAGAQGATNVAEQGTSMSAALSGGNLPPDPEAADIAAAAVAKAEEAAAAAAAQHAADRQARAVALGAELAAALRTSVGTAATPHVEVTSSSEGLLINLTDDLDFSMFPIGSAIPHPKLVKAMENVAAVLKERPGQVLIRGYTDARPFRSETYDNWRLSTARAHMAYYMLTRGGLDSARIEQIEGHADRNLKNPDDPNAAENRRIEIVLQVPE